jgi:hypothetical protein
MSDQILPGQFRSWMEERRALFFNLAGRLKPGQPLNQAGANLVVIAKSLEENCRTPGEPVDPVRPLTNHDFSGRA